MSNVSKVYVSAVKTQWKHIKHKQNCAFHVEYMVHVYFGKFMWNVPKVHVSALKTQWKHMKTLAKLCISCRI
jgi:hypothetical protein